MFSMTVLRVRHAPYVPIENCVIEKIGYMSTFEDCVIENIGYMSNFDDCVIEKIGYMSTF
jgi:hypothetical protein